MGHSAGNLFGVSTVVSSGMRGLPETESWTGRCGRATSLRTTSTVRTERSKPFDTMKKSILEYSPDDPRQVPADATINWPLIRFIHPLDWSTDASRLKSPPITKGMP